MVVLFKRYKIKLVKYLCVATVYIYCIGRICLNWIVKGIRISGSKQCLDSATIFF
jgi:hypothetical protein